MRLSRILLWAIAVTAVLTIVAPLVLFYYPIGRLQLAVVVGAGILLLLYLVCAMTCAVAMESGRAPRLMRSGMIAGAIAIVSWLGLIAIEPDWPILLAVQRVIIWPSVWVCLMMLVALTLMPRPHQRWWLALRNVTIGALALVAIHIALAFTFYPNADEWQTQREYEDAAVRVGGALAVLAAAMMIFTMLTAWAPRFLGDRVTHRPQLSYWLRCPRCEYEQSATTGAHACARCGLNVRVEVA
jgi:hypothetical protein